MAPRRRALILYSHNRNDLWQNFEMPVSDLLIEVSRFIKHFEFEFERRFDRATGFKRCPGCRFALPLGEFCSSRNCWDGLAIYCRSCYRVKMRRHYAERDRRRLKDWITGFADMFRSELDLSWRFAVEGFKECRKCRVWRSRDRFGADFKDVPGLNGWCRRCLRLEQSKLRKVRRRPKTERVRARLGAGKRCYLCGGGARWDDPFEFDHVVPLARGGSNGLGNLRHCHRSCNNAKGAMTVLEYMMSRESGAVFPENSSPPVQSSLGGAVSER